MGNEGSSLNQGSATPASGTRDAAIAAQQGPPKTLDKTVVIEPGKELYVDTEALGKGSVVRYFFGINQAEDADIFFELVFVSSENKEMPIFRKARVQPPHYPEGMYAKFTVGAPGFIRFKFGNGHAWILSKAVTYAVEVVNTLPAVPAETNSDDLPV